MAGGGEGLLRKQIAAAVDKQVDDLTDRDIGQGLRMLTDEVDPASQIAELAADRLGKPGEELNPKELAEGLDLLVADDAGLTDVAEDWLGRKAANTHEIRWALNQSADADLAGVRDRILDLPAEKRPEALYRVGESFRKREEAYNNAVKNGGDPDAAMDSEANQEDVLDDFQKELESSGDADDGRVFDPEASDDQGAMAGRGFSRTPPEPGEQTYEKGGEGGEGSGGGRGDRTGSGDGSGVAPMTRAGEQPGDDPTSQFAGGASDPNEDDGGGGGGAGSGGAMDVGNVAGKIPSSGGQPAPQPDADPKQDSQPQNQQPALQPEAQQQDSGGDSPADDSPDPDAGESVDVVFTVATGDVNADVTDAEGFGDGAMIDFHRSEDGRWFDEAGHEVTEEATKSVLEGQYENYVNSGGEVTGQGSADSVTVNEETFEEAVEKAKKEAEAEKAAAEAEAEDEDESESAGESADGDEDEDENADQSADQSADERADDSENTDDSDTELSTEGPAREQLRQFAEEHGLAEDQEEHALVKGPGNVDPVSVDMVSFGEGARDQQAGFVGVDDPVDGQPGRGADPGGITQHDRGDRDPLDSDPSAGSGPGGDPSDVLPPGGLFGGNDSELAEDFLEEDNSSSDTSPLDRFAVDEIEPASGVDIGELDL